MPTLASVETVASDRSGLDALDRQLLHALQIDARTTFGWLARVLGVSDQTVIRRYARMRLVSGLRVVGTLDPRPGGGTPWYVRARVTPDAATPIAQAMARRPDTAWVRLVSGGTEIVCSVRAGEQTLLLDMLPRTARVLDVSAQSELHVFTRNAHRVLQGTGALSEDQVRALRGDGGVGERRAGLRLDAVDHALVAVLQGDGRASLEQLAAATGRPASTVRRRLARLLASGAVRIEVDVDPRALGLHTQTLLWMSVEPAHLQATGDALAMHPEVVFAAATTGSTNLYASIMTPDVHTLYRYLTRSVAALPAIRDLESAPVIRTLKGVT